MDMQAGAPPDDFAVKGQNWGFPTYNWEVMASNDYSWWKLRFEQMSFYFDAFRIDHILGFLEFGVFQWIKWRVSWEGLFQQSQLRIRS